MQYWGVIDSRGDQYSTHERLHLIRCLSQWQANLYIFGQLSWERAIQPSSEFDCHTFAQIAERCREFGIHLWAWMKPGDYRYVYHQSDRQQFVANALRYMDMGATGFYLLMDDLHPRSANDPMGHIRPQDAEYHAKLITALDAALGDRFKAICGEHYCGDIPGECSAYWAPILEVLPKRVLLTWTGPSIWNKHLTSDNIPQVGWPLLLFDNYFASDTHDPKRAPIYPYDGRSADLKKQFEVAVINPNNHYAWQYCALKTAMAFWLAPDQYNAEESFREAIRELGDTYMNDYKRLVK
jgi:hypothetical protein